MNRLLAAALFALLAFAANSVLCRMALRESHIDPASFTSVRLIAGAVTLWLLVRFGGAAPAPAAAGVRRSRSSCMRSPSRSRTSG